MTPLTHQFLVNLPEPLYRALGDAAHHHNVSMAHLARAALAAYLHVPPTVANPPHGNQASATPSPRLLQRQQARHARRLLALAQAADRAACATNGTIKKEVAS